jgi:hypothetical protein
MPHRALLPATFPVPGYRSIRRLPAVFATTILRVRGHWYDLESDATFELDNTQTADVHGRKRRPLFAVAQPTSGYQWGDEMADIHSNRNL